ncbi:hypothetical protein [Micromonospora sp. NPDC023737]|uniref:hypothetical protein n=1 Tax=unclassified Micromonospora TaxID=2617518 RepID=UPI0033C1A4E4
MGVTHRRLAGAALALAILPSALAGCGLGGEAEESPKPDQAPAEEADAKSRERVQAYLDAVVAKDVDAGRSQLCAVMHEAFDAAATGPNGDFADHFKVPEAAITDIGSGPRGQQVNVSVTVAVGSRKVVRPLVFTVTRDGADWCISGEAPGSATPSPSGTPVS